MKSRYFFLLLFAALVATRLCHSGILWEPETFPLAAATQILHGKALYAGIWYDKPPLAPLWYVLQGARDGWILRATGALYALLACFVTYRFARDLWTRREGLWAASLLAFFLTFDIPVSVIPIGPDLLMLTPHVAAVWLAFRKQALASGLAAGIAFLTNVKGAFVLAACALFCYPALLPLAAGFAIPCALLAGVWNNYVSQVWIWSSAYAGNTFLPNPVANGLLRTLNWLGFHAALVLGAIWRAPWRLWAWLAISFAGVAMGWRFFPRYYLQILPVLAILASRGIVRLGRRGWAIAALCVIPLARFGPRYLTLITNPGVPWTDTAMDRDSRAAALKLRELAHPGDTLFIWGYRPELWVYTRMPDGARFLDCQALTGVPADRHLTQSEPVADGHAARQELARSHPTFIADGISAFNPKLVMSNYPELREWFAGYELVARTGSTLIYRRIPSPRM